jgi:hypothetical protein
MAKELHRDTVDSSENGAEGMESYLKLRPAVQWFEAAVVEYQT